MSYIKDLYDITGGRASPKDSPADKRQVILKKMYNRLLIEMYTHIDAGETEQAHEIQKELDNTLKLIEDYTSDDIMGGFRYTNG